MGKSDVPSLSTFECRSVLDSIQSEYDKLQKEENSLSKLHEELAELISQRTILAKTNRFNERNCVICCLAFNLLFKRKLLCQSCGFWVCRSCATWDQNTKNWLCHVCEKQKLLDTASSEWICTRIKDNFGHFSSAKALQNFFRQRRISDSENDSGYGTAGDFMPLMKYLSSHSLNRDLKMTDVSSHDEECDEEEIGDEEELHEIQDSIETILEGLLGGTLDDALVDQLYPNSAIYLNLFNTYHNKLVDVIENLSKALQKALHNLPTENGVTPTSAHAALKNVIANLVEECQDIPSLETPCNEDLEYSVMPEMSSSTFAGIISSYESLVASAIINKVVEESQSKFRSHDLMNLNITSKQEFEKFSGEIESSIADGEEILNVLNSTSFDLPVQCVQIEEVEEITQEFTDSEDDKLSSISKYSNSRQNLDEVGIPKNSDFDVCIDLEHCVDVPIAFPEFGCDLVEDQVNENSLTPCHLVSVTSWEDNWLFKKKKRLPLYSNMKYQLLTYCDEPPSMFIPYPSDITDLASQDELSSELSETHSTGTLDFSSDSESAEVKESELQLHSISLSKSNIQMFHDSSPYNALAKETINKKSELCHIDDNHDDAKYSEVNPNKIGPEKSKEIVKCQTTVEMESKEMFLKKEDPEIIPDIEKTVVENILLETPPRPGTIAEREHQKWLNAIPLKHNPYSAENISKRNRFNSSGLQEHASSFEEFERKLSVSSDTIEMPLNKVNCGPKSIDKDLYKRDYYVNKDMEISEASFSMQKCTLPLITSPNDHFELLSEEALNSFEEKVYIRSGKVFTLENRIKCLERELKDGLSISPEPTKTFAYHQDYQMPKSKVEEWNTSVDHHKDNTSLPSVKGLADKFIPQRLKESLSHEVTTILNNQDSEKIKKSKPCRKVHSLTARSLSREFRDLARQNVPKPMNRTAPVLSPPCDEGDRENLCSSESIQSSLSTTPGDNGHGYTSDESNTSSNSQGRLRGKRQISRSILERATYWERRAEQGLLSDASVNEEFPSVNVDD